MHSVGLMLAEGLWIQGGYGQYRLDYPLGKGGFGRAWAATSADGTGLVVKQLKLQRLGDWKALELFEREGRVLASLSHPLIPRHIEMFAHDGQRAYPVSALAQLQTASLISVYVRVDGYSLGQHLNSGAVLHPDTTRNMLDQLLGVLDYLHSLQPPVIHRDIKPDNIIVAPDGSAHLVDFGAIKNHMRDGSTSVGTFGYFAMEQMTGQSQPANDLYALAMTMLVVATRVRPEDMPIDAATGKVDLAQVGQNLTPGVRAVLERALEPVIGNRIATATQARALLHRPDEELLDIDFEVSQHLTRRRTRVIANVCLAVGGCGAGFLYLVVFNSLSEGALVQLSGLWIAPVVYALAAHGALVVKMSEPASFAGAVTGVAMLILILFYIVLWPAL